MMQRPTTGDLRPVPSECRFVFVSGHCFVVTKVLIQTTSTLFEDAETEYLLNEDPQHFHAYLQWVHGHGISNQTWARGDMWLVLGELWFFGERIGALQFQDAVMLECLEKRGEAGVNELTISHFFDPPFEIKSPFHTFLVDTYFMQPTTTDLLNDYDDNILFTIACSARQVYLSEAIAKMFIKKRKREQKQREEKKRRSWKLLPGEGPVEEPITLSVLHDYIVSTPSPSNDNRTPSGRLGDDSSDEDERGSTRMRGSVRLDLIKRVLKYGTID